FCCSKRLIAIDVTEWQIKRLEQQKLEAQKKSEEQTRAERRDPVEEQPATPATPDPVDVESAVTSEFPLEMPEGSDPGGANYAPDDPRAIKEVENASKRKLAKMIWVDDKQIRAKYRGYFRHYLR